MSHSLMTGLGCDFLTEPCNDRSTFPYLCDTSPTQLVCTYDHLTKVCNYCNVIVYINTYICGYHTYIYIRRYYFIVVTYVRAIVLTLGLDLMISLLYLLLEVTPTVELKP